MLSKGDRAPPFTAKDQDSNTVSFSDFQGRQVVLYFYPKDDTPGCTTEACGFRDIAKELQDRGCIVLGCSADDEESHKRFAEKYRLNFPLLADTNQAIAKTYGVLQEGKIARTTFILDEMGRIKRTIPNVNPEGHAKEVLEAVS